MVAPLAMAQYPGHIKPDDQKKPDEPRAVSILEWVGDPGKPVASRIVPLSVFVNGAYQDGGLYLAQPAPLTVENDTLYELEQAGIPKGTFYVAGGQEVGGAWFGYGKWKPLDPAEAAEETYAVQGAAEGRPGQRSRPAPFEEQQSGLELKRFNYSSKRSRPTHTASQPQFQW